MRAATKRARLSEPLLYGEISYDCSSNGAATTGAGAAAAGVAMACSGAEEVKATGAGAGLGAGAGSAAETTTATGAAATGGASGATLREIRSIALVLCDATLNATHTNLAGAAVGCRAAAARSSSARALLSSTCKVRNRQRKNRRRSCGLTRLALRFLSQQQLLLSLTPVSLGKLLVRLSSGNSMRSGTQPRVTCVSHLHRLLQPRRQHGSGAHAALCSRAGGHWRQLGRHVRRPSFLEHRRLLLHGGATGSLTLPLKFRLLGLALVMDALLRVTREAMSLHEGDVKLRGDAPPACAQARLPAEQGSCHSASPPAVRLQAAAPAWIEQTEMTNSCGSPAAQKHERMRTRLSEGALRCMLGLTPSATAGAART